MSGRFSANSSAPTGTASSPSAARLTFGPGAKASIINCRSPLSAPTPLVFQKHVQANHGAREVLLQKLAERDPRLAPFARGVTDLAARFKMKAIRQFVARYRPPVKTET